MVLLYSFRTAATYTFFRHLCGQTVVWFALGTLVADWCFFDTKAVFHRVLQGYSVQQLVFCFVR